MDVCAFGSSVYPFHYRETSYVDFSRKNIYPMDQKSKDKMKGVDSRLVSVVELAYTYSPVKFIVTEGLRTVERQTQLVKQGASKTMNSKHLTGKAVDLAPVVDGKVRWDWPLFYPMADAMKKAALELKVPLQWGGDWRTFKDGPHFEIKE